MSNVSQVEDLLKLAQDMGVVEIPNSSETVEVSTQPGLKTIDNDILTKGVTSAVKMVRTSLGARKSAWTTVVEACEASNLMHPDVPEAHARSALIEVGNQIQWYKGSDEETVAALTSSTWRTIQSDILLAKAYTIPLTRTDDTGAVKARGKTSVERDIKSRKVEDKRQSGSESVTALTNLNARIGGAMIGANAYVSTLKDGPISDWTTEAERQVSYANEVDKTCSDVDKESMVNMSSQSSMAVKKELATVIASIDLVRETLTRTLGDFTSLSDGAELRTKIFASAWEEKSEDDLEEENSKPDDQWAESEDE